MLCVFDKGMISSRGTFTATETEQRVVFILLQGRPGVFGQESKREEKK